MKTITYESTELGCVFSHHSCISCFCLEKLIMVFRAIDLTVNKYMNLAEKQQQQKN